MRDTQSPNRALPAVQGTNTTTKEQRSDHKVKSPVDMQYREQNRRKQYCMNVGIFAFENSHQAFVNDALGKYFLQQNRKEIQFHSQSELEVKERLSLREKCRSTPDQNCLIGI